MWFQTLRWTRPSRGRSRCGLVVCSSSCAARREQRRAQLSAAAAAALALRLRRVGCFALGSTAARTAGSRPRPGAQFFELGSVLMTSSTARRTCSSRRSASDAPFPSTGARRLIVATRVRRATTLLLRDGAGREQEPPTSASTPSSSRLSCSTRAARRGRPRCGARPARGAALCALAGAPAAQRRHNKPRRQPSTHRAVTTPPAAARGARAVARHVDRVASAHWSRSTKAPALRAANATRRFAESWVDRAHPRTSSGRRAVVRFTKAKT